MADHYDEDRAAEYLGECEAQWASGDAFAYAIIVGDQIVGSAGLHRRGGRRSGSTASTYGRQADRRCHRRLAA